MLKKLNNKKGFTLMEMLIVVAIIAVLVAIAIPVFNGALTKSKESADVANIRAAYAEVQAEILTDDADVPDEAAFKAKTGDLNYDGNLNYVLSQDKSTATITYSPKKLTGGNGTAESNNLAPFTWTLKTATFTDN